MKSLILLFLLCSSWDTHARIRNGKSVKASEAPWVVRILDNGLESCTGSIISAKWILTAAHCLDGQTPSEVTVWGGGNGKLRNLIQLPAVKRLIIYPTYQNNKSDDIALIELQKPISYSNVLRPISILSNMHLEILRHATMVTIYGWGHTQPGHSPVELRKITLPIVQNTALKSKRNYLNPSKNIMVINDRYSTCAGDSGGSWVINITGTDYLAGVHSAGDCLTYSTAIRAGRFSTWIRRYL